MNPWARSLQSIQHSGQNYDSNNKKAIAEKKIAYNKLGIDETSVDKDRWEKDKSNLQFGLDYAEGLINNDEYELAIDVCNELLVYDAENKRLLKTISNAYMSIYEEDKGLVYLEKLSAIEPQNAEIMLEISEVCIDLSLFKKVIAPS